MRAETRQHAHGAAKVAQHGARAKIVADIGLDHRTGGIPDVQRRVKRAGHAFDHNHRALQQNQLGAGFHAETLGHLEQMGKQPPDGDLRGVMAENRRGHGAQGLSELVDIAIGRHIAGFEMHFGRAAIIPVQKPHQDFGIDPARIGVYPAHDAKIIGDQVAIVGALQVALMHIAMKQPVAQRLTQEKLDDAGGEFMRVIAGRGQRLHITKRHTIGPARCHHPARRQVPMQLWHGETGIIGGVLGKFIAGRGFGAQIQLGQHHAFEMLDHLARAQTAGLRGDERNHPGGKVEGIDIAQKGALDSGAQHLYGNGFACRAQLCLMHLCQRGGRNGFGKLREYIIKPDAKLALHLGFGDGAFEGGQPVLQHAQLGGEVFAHKVGPCAEQLAEFDIGGAKGCKRAQNRRLARVALQAKPGKGPAQNTGGNAQAARGVERIKRHTHCAGTFKRGAGADQPPDIMRPPQIFHPECSAAMPSDRLR